MKSALAVSLLFLITMCFASNQAYAAGAWTGNVNIFYGCKTLNSSDYTAHYSDLNIDVAGFDFTMADEIGKDVKLAVDKASEFGISADFGPKSLPVCFVIGYFNATGNDSGAGSIDFPVTDYNDPTISYNVTEKSHAKLEVETRELRFGVKKIWELKMPIRPYIGGGLSWVHANIDIPYDLKADVPYYQIYNYPVYSNKYSDSDSAIGYWLSSGAYWTFSKQYNVGVEVSYSKASVTLFDKDREAGGFHYGLFAGYHW